jgi:hypothetical protein
VDEAGALPVSNGELVHVEARLSRPGYAYLLWADGEGAISALYPWNDSEIERGLGDRPPARGALALIHSPREEKDGWPMTGKSGLDTIVLLARSTPLPASVDLAGLVGRLGPTELRDELEVVVRGYEAGGEAEAVRWQQHRGPAKVAEAIDHPLVRLLGRLRGEFEVVRAVRFAHKGDDGPQKREGRR